MPSVATSPVVGEAIPALAEARRHDRRSGGAPYAARSAARSPTTIRPRIIPPPASALGATIVTNKRKHQADDFFKGLFETALEADEIITKVQFPMAEEGRLR